MNKGEVTWLEWKLEETRQEKKRKLDKWNEKKSIHPGGKRVTGSRWTVRFCFQRSPDPRWRLVVYLNCNFRSDPHNCSSVGAVSVRPHKPSSLSRWWPLTSSTRQLRFSSNYARPQPARPKCCAPQSCCYIYNSAETDGFDPEMKTARRMVLKLTSRNFIHSWRHAICFLRSFFVLGKFVQPSVVQFNFAGKRSHGLMPVLKPVLPWEVHEHWNYFCIILTVLVNDYNLLVLTNAHIVLTYISTYLHVSAGPAHFIKPKCCFCFKQIFFGVQVIMDDSYLLGNTYIYMY